MGWDLGLAFRLYSGLQPLMPRVEAAAKYAQKIQGDPEVEKAIAFATKIAEDPEAKQMVATFQKYFGDPEAKDAIQIVLDVIAAVKKAQAEQ